MPRLLAPLFLVALFANDAFARPPSPILTVEVGPTARHITRPGQTRLELQVSSDGTFELDGRPGALPRPALRELQRAISKTRFVLAPMARVNCMAIPVRRTFVTSQRGKVSWAAPCDRSPHPSVHALLESTRALLGPHLHPVPEQPAPTAPSPIVSYQVTRHTGPMRGESLILMSDGSWTHQNASGARSGVLAAADLNTLRERMRSVHVGAAPRVPHCAALLHGHGTVTLEGRGTHTFSVPCTEFDPSLDSFLSELRRLTR